MPTLQEILAQALSNPDTGPAKVQSPLDAYSLRYGVDATDKVSFANSGIPLGTSPSVAQSRPDEADRAASSFLGTEKHGPFAAAAFNEFRNNSGLAGLMGESPEDRDRLREQAILASSRAVDERNRGVGQAAGTINALRGSGTNLPDDRLKEILAALRSRGQIGSSTL